ncbi:MAG: hypothetical protein AAF744_02875 [Pseudomonadota bacterium]
MSAARWLWWLPLALLTVFCAIVGLRYGMQVVNTTETDVIAHYAARYVAETGEGARLTDCVAAPADEMPHVWLKVLCRPPGSPGKVTAYLVNRFGGLEAAPPRGGDLHEPQT